MELLILSTGSKGNAYLLKGGDQSLLLDAGLPVGKISRGIEFKGLQGCLVTHEHMDHAKAAVDMANRGVTVVTSEGTAKAIGLSGSFARIVKVGETVQLGVWSVMAFDTRHDAVEPLGFLIRNNRSGEKVVYATDTYYIKYRFPKAHYWIVEANYIDETLIQQVADGRINPKMEIRLRKSHMSLRRLLQALEANDLSEVRKIVLVHLSDDRSDEERMVREIKQLTGKDAVAASDGMLIDLELTPF